MAKRPPLTEKEREESRRLRAIWDAKRVELKMTQEALAHALGFGTQGAVAHYLNGKQRISDATLVRIANILRFDPRDVRPEVLTNLPVDNLPISGVTPEAQEFAIKFEKLSVKDRALVRSILDRLED